MNDLRGHLVAPLSEGGHALPLAVEYRDHEQMHTDDHWPGAWWLQALTHSHDDPEDNCREV